MGFTINEFRGALAGGGARPNLFAVKLNVPSGLDGRDHGGSSMVPFMVKTTAIPGQTIGAVDVPYMGRTLKVAGNTTFDTWETTIINDEDFKVRKFVESWAELINGRADNLATSSNPTDYTANGSVIQYSKTGKPIRQYAIIGAFPTTLGQIDLGWDSNDALEEFSVTWTFSWWETKDTTFDEGNGAGIAGGAELTVDTPVGDFTGGFNFGFG